MPTEAELMEQRAKLVRDCEAVMALADSEKRELTEEEASKIDAAQKEVESLDAKIDAAKSQQARRDWISSRASDLKKPEDKTTKATVFAQARTDDKWRSFGEQMMAVRAAATGDVRSRNMLEQRAEAERRTTGMTSGVGSEGGFLVQTDFSTALLNDTLEASVMYGRCRRFPVGSNFNGITFPVFKETSRASSLLGGIIVYRAPEAGSITATRPDLGQVEIKLQKMMAVCYVTDELLMDGIGLDGYLRSSFPLAMGQKLDDEVVNGNGASGCLGILTSGATIGVAKETGQAAATIKAENIEKMYSRLWSRGRGSSVWFINQACWPQIFQLSHSVGLGGVPMFIPAGGLTSSPAGTLMGRPIVECEYCQDLGTKGDILYCDMGQYLLAEKGGIDTAVSMEVEFLTAQQVYRFIWRVNGQPAWSSALTPAKSSSTISPFVALNTRA